jgi:hypothetical protein
VELTSVVSAWIMNGKLVGTIMPSLRLVFKETALLTLAKMGSLQTRYPQDSDDHSVT